MRLDTTRVWRVWDEMTRMRRRPMWLRLGERDAARGVYFASAVAWTPARTPGTPPSRKGVTPMPAGTARLRVGAFDLDLRSAELWQDGLKVRLQEQPFRVLLALAERPGEVVTREELRQRLWSADTYVDFERSLNAAVKRLREALGESAGAPRYIETLPRHGYRLIAPVEPSTGPASPGPVVGPAAAKPSAAAVPVFVDGPGVARDDRPAASLDVPVALRPRRWRRSRTAIVVATALVVVAAAGAVWWWARQAGTSPVPQSALDPNR